MTAPLARSSDPNITSTSHFREFPEPGYYRCIEQDGSIEEGQYVYLLRVERDEVYFQRRDKAYRTTLADFWRRYEADPEGAAVFQADLAAAMADLQQTTQKMTQIGAVLADTTLYVNPALPGQPGGPGELAGLDGLAALVPLPDRSAATARRALAEVRNQAQRYQLTLGTKQQALQGLLAEQAAIAQAAAAPFQALAKRLTEGLWTLDLYLGKEEEFVALAEGAPAPVDTPITVRQLVLAMDEECAVAAEEGGIDALSMEKFDAWLLADPAHLQQVLPEPKGVVALKVRRSSKDYQDPWLKKDMDEANRRCYWLIRNGDRLWRMTTDFDPGWTLFPKREEFLGFFYQERYNFDTGQKERTPLVPGSREYARAEEQADARSRHYLRVGLILQGLLDRTTVFHPLPGPMHITQPEAHERGWVRLIYDADLVLQTGRPSFRDWLKALNERLDVGMRIVGNFNGRNSLYGDFGSLGDSKSGRHERLSPPRSSYPSSLHLYTLEGRREGGFYFLYQREGWNWETLERRGSCVIYPRDLFILNFDAATIEEMEFYLHSRVNRHEYAAMFPLLKAAIRLKREEAAQEEPFRRLLAGQIMERYGVDWATAEEAVPELVSWYKLANRHHRPLVGDDDGKALRLIVREFGIRQKQQQREARAQGEGAHVVATVLAQWPEAVLVAHKEGATYVALLPCRPDENVWVTEIEVGPDGQERRRYPWRLVGARAARWRVLHETERWGQWLTHASVAEHLTDEERMRLALEARDRATRSETGKRRYPWGGDSFTCDGRPMAVTYHPRDRKFHVYYLQRLPIVPEEPRFGARVDGATVGRFDFTWKRGAGRVPALSSAGAYTVSVDRGMPWESSSHILWEDTEVVDEARAQQASYLAVRRTLEGLRARVHRAETKVEAQWQVAEEARRYQAFLAEHGAPDLWEGHRKTLRAPVYPHGLRSATGSLLRRALEWRVERHEPLAGLTVAELLETYVAGPGEGASLEARDALLADLGAYLLEEPPAAEAPAAETEA
jgi:hypothetical protein